MHRSICIILLNYKNDCETIACVRSIFDSSCQKRPFIVIVDNSGLESVLKDKLNFYPDLHVLVPEKNLGFASGNNFGIIWALNHLSFDFLFILNNDTLLLKDTIDKLVEYAINNPDIKYIAPCIITDNALPKIWYAGGVIKKWLLTPRINLIESNFKSVQLVNCFTTFFSGCAIFIHAGKVDLRNGLFDPRFFMYDEDVELSLRIRKDGYLIAFLAEAVVIHKCQRSQISDSNVKINQLDPGSKNLIFYLRNTIKNRFYIADKHYFGFESFLIKSAMAIYWILKSAQYAIHFKFRATFTVLSEIAKYKKNKI
jgi:GT2 family glycosyltransferase